jgi:hypothetical protein
MDREQFSMTVWPTIGATRLGRLVGQFSGNKLGVGFFTLGKLFALAMIPLALAVYVWQILPFLIRRYRLTDRRVVVQKGLVPKDERFIDLDAFDAIEIAVLPGQAWLRAGDLVFTRNGQEVFRLPGVSRPEAFRQVCQKAQMALLSVRKVLDQQKQGAHCQAGGSEMAPTTV